MRTLLAACFCLLLAGCPADSNKTKNPIPEAKISWEKIEHPDTLWDVHRTRVPEGWLVSFRAYSENYFMLQLHDPNHIWTIGTWEKVPHPVINDVYRLKVPNGWLLSSSESSAAAQAEFIFDAEVEGDKIKLNSHKWLAGK